MSVVFPWERGKLSTALTSLLSTPLCWILMGFKVRETFTGLLSGGLDRISKALSSDFERVAIRVQQGFNGISPWELDRSMGSDSNISQESKVFQKLLQRVSDHPRE